MSNSSSAILTVPANSFLGKTGRLSLMSSSMTLMILDVRCCGTPRSCTCTCRAYEWRISLSSLSENKNNMTAPYFSKVSSRRQQIANIFLCLRLFMMKCNIFRLALQWGALHRHMWNTEKKSRKAAFLNHIIKTYHSPTRIIRLAKIAFITHKQFHCFVILQTIFQNQHTRYCAFARLTYCIIFRVVASNVKEGEKQYCK